jgi:hypothetical protein
MHLIVPFAGALAEPGRAALRHLGLPQLQALLARCETVARDEGDEFSLSAPHERVLARAFGWAAGDGRLPFAARAAAADGLEVGQLAWGLISPTHWHLGTEQVSLVDPAALSLDDETSRELFAAVLALFTSEGFVMRYGHATRWYIAHESLADLRCASLDRVFGRNVDRWLDPDPAARLLRRLQNEVQMLLYTHPVNERREAQGLLPVNSFWLSGCGVAQPAKAAVLVDDSLRGPALAEDWAGWVKAWEALDAALPTRLDGGDFRLTLCGERSALTLAPGAGRLQRLRAMWARPDPVALLEAL